MTRTRIALSLFAVAALVAGCHKPAKDMNGVRVKVQGSYAQTCRNVVDGADGAISAECEDAKGLFHATSIKASDCKTPLANNNGTLFCGGATGVAGPAMAGPASDSPASDAAASTAPASSQP